MDKHPLTIRLDEALLKIVKAQAAQTRSSLGAVVVDAAKQALMPEYREKQEQTLLRAVDRCFNRLVKVHEDQQTQHELVKEMLALFVRMFLLHTPPVRPQDTEMALAGAARRFESFLDILAANRRDRRSVMDPVPKQQVAPSASSKDKPEAVSSPPTLFGTSRS
jgi:hypothetical protein